MKGLSGYVRLRHATGASLVAYKTSADVVSKAVTLVVTVAAARSLPPGDFGVMALAMTSGWILGVASDAGLPMHLATRVAQDGGRARQIVRDVMRWRWRLGLVAIAAGSAFGAALVGSSAWLAFTLIVIHQLLGAMLDTLAHAYRGLGRTDIESSLSLAHRGTVALAALMVLALQPTLLLLSIALAVPPLIALGASHLIVRRLTPATGDSPSTLDSRVFLADVAPLGLGVLLSALYFRCDVYFLEWLHGVEMVGVYNAAFRTVDALRLFPAAALAVAYPSLCAATSTAPLRKLSFVLLAAALAVTGAIYTGAAPLLALVYGDSFASGGRALQMLALCMPFFYVNYALTHQLIAWGGRRAYLAITAAALLANLAGNALLIPDGGMVGAAISTLCTEIVVCCGCLVALRKQ